ncbi:PstS family phosphate ABC transporter substrate-binding protein [Microaerobacter geothermalis]|nr:PstS family phosphate ABC transporter substrate-binding protein [Microaerobacter geothermalis]MCF6093712.1 PstS family phosphate ABC transporter substrate-binding protein [Microaerobacter geothermalis]
MNGLKKSFVVLGIFALTMILLVGCGAANDQKTEEKAAETKLSGEIQIDGSSTVFPISEAVAEEFMAANPDVRVNVGVSGTGGGFKKFTVGETDISDASRPIKDSEAQKAKENGIEYIEIPVAFDGLSVVVNPENDFVDYLTTEELKKIWEPNSQVTKWSQVREGWPDEEIKLYGPGTDSGTFDYFTEVINGEDGASRSDYTASEDDNVLVQGIAGDKYSLGYFGYAYYIENKDKIKVVPIDGGNGPIEPTDETVNNGTYAPLSRPIFIYVSKKSLQRPEVKAFVEYYLTEGPNFVPEVGYVPLPQDMYEKSLAEVQAVK